MVTIVSAEPMVRSLDQAEPLVPPPSADRLYRLSVERYDALARQGILTKDDRVELIEGLLVEKMTKNERHLTTTWLIDQAMGRGLPTGWFAVTESPLQLSHSQPEPDVLVIRGRVQDYFTRKPRPDDVALVVEVSDSSYAEDRARRALYAEARLPVYWIVNIPAGRIEVYTDPTGPDALPDYRTRRDFGRDDEVAVILDGQKALRLRVGDLLPPPEPNKT